MQYSCEKCGYSTSYKQHFIKHQNRKSSCSIVDKVEKKFPCKYCSVEYKHRQSTFRHEKTCSARNEIDNLKSKLEESEKLIAKERLMLLQNLFKMYKTRGLIFFSIPKQMSASLPISISNLENLIPKGSIRYI